MKKAALVSVSDKTGLEAFAKVLVTKGYTLLSTSGTLQALLKSGIDVISVADYTGQPEILDGRVKTLHPKIHAGLLARRDNQEHMKELADHDIMPIDIAVVNLYPFAEVLKSKSGQAPLAGMVEYIDIGGPTMIRAAAKNINAVTAIIDPADYEKIISQLEEKSEINQQTRLELSEKVFRTLAIYNLQIASYLGEQEGAETTAGIILKKEEALRYGENPHQSGVFFSIVGEEKASWKQLSGKTLSYNNYLDLDAALRMARSFAGGIPAIALLKHCNPCGFASKQTIEEALESAQKCDPRSHFGGVVASNTMVTLAAAEKMAESFYEIIVAPAFAEDALTLLKTKKALRIIQYDPSYSPCYEYRSVEGGILRQNVDMVSSALTPDLLVSTEVSMLTPETLKELELAWTCVRHVKSNAIVIVKDSQLIGVGAGQMSRIDSCQLAIQRALQHGHNLKGAVAASDAFFPFADGVEFLADAGITAIVAPGGAKRDEEICEIASQRGVALLFAPTRHFRH
jgi:phosphoribosylaminoimidazolecarboxamide formyltransferase / IMP cyclohydrolase